jgi:endo-alpha-1,4-polygalactosaminidase (GH114 family)
MISRKLVPAAFLFALVAVPLVGQEPKRFQPASFQLYYGSDPAVIKQMTMRLARGQVVVVESSAFKKPDLQQIIKKADEVGAKVLAYLSIGELNDQDEKRFRTFLQGYLAVRPKDAVRLTTLEALTIGRDVPFKARYIDVLGDAWRAYVLAEADRLYALGVHGLFLDTVDTVDLYITRKDWSLARRIDSIEAMQGLVRSIKGRHRSGYVIQNRGLNLIGPKVFVGDATGKEIDGLALAEGHSDNPDGILWENAFVGQDDWSRLKEKQLREIQKSGRTTVFALGYKETAKNPDDFFRKCKEAGFVGAWATSSATLHKELTTGPQEMPR